MNGSLATRMRRFQQEHRKAESSRRGIYEKCWKCGEAYPLGVLTAKLCGLCQIELQDEPRYVLEEWAGRTKGRIVGSHIVW